MRLGDEGRHQRAFTPYGFAHPGNVIPAQQITEILRRKIACAGIALLLRQTRKFQQSLVGRVGIDQLLVVSLEAGGQYKVAFKGTDLLQVRLCKQAQQRVAKLSGRELVGVVVQLVEQYRREVQRNAYTRVRLEVRSHVAVILDGVQIHPGLRKFSGRMVAEIRL